MLPLMSNATTTITGNFGGLLNPIASATNGDRDRQYAWTILGSGDASGAEITVTYTLSTSSANLTGAFAEDNLFRYPGGSNMPSGQNITITINTIAINEGWILNSVSMTDTVRVAIQSGRTARFSVNGGSTFDYVGTGSGVSQQNVTNSQFQNFNSPGDSIFFQNVNQTENGGMNLRNLQMTFDVIPEPTTALLGGLGMLFLLRRRRA